jgi:hypothetical protein
MEDKDVTCACPDCAARRAEFGERMAWDLVDMLLLAISAVDSLGGDFDPTKLAGREPTLGDLPEVMQIYFSRAGHETDRGCILVSVSYLDHLLTQTLLAAMLDDEDARHLVEHMDFARRIKLAQAMGLIPNAVRDDLHQLKQIRNTAAHDWTDLRFSEPAILRRLEQLHHDPVRGPSEPRRRFMRVMAVLAGELERARRRASRPVSPASAAIVMRERIEQEGFALRPLIEALSTALQTGDHSMLAEVTRRAAESSASTAEKS